MCRQALRCGFHRSVILPLCSHINYCCGASAFIALWGDWSSSHLQCIVPSFLQAPGRVCIHYPLFGFWGFLLPISTRNILLLFWNNTKGFGELDVASERYLYGDCMPQPDSIPLRCAHKNQSRFWGAKSFIVTSDVTPVVGSSSSGNQTDTLVLVEYGLCWE